MWSSTWINEPFVYRIHKAVNSLLMLKNFFEVLRIETFKPFYRRILRVLYLFIQQNYFNKLPVFTPASITNTCPIEIFFCLEAHKENSTNMNKKSQGVKVCFFVSLRAEHSEKRVQWIGWRKKVKKNSTKKFGFWKALLIIKYIL